MDTATAYPVPLSVDRSRGPRVQRLVNVGDEPLLGLRVTLLDSGLLVPVATSCLDPGSSMSVSVIGPELERRGIAVVRWFRPDGDEYLWRFSF
jgi:hypothetical protein